MRRLLDEREAATAIISAPPGYGKTSLLAEWADRDARPFACVSLDGTHNHPANLLSAILSALDQLEPLDRSVERRCRRALRAEEAGPLSAVLEEVASLVGAMGATRRPAVLVLDDAHLLKSRGALQVLFALACATPRGAKFALASRTAPALRLGRLRAQHQLLELGARDLAMTAYEAHQLLRAAGLELDRVGVDRLVTRTEGWPAALYLAALWLRPQADVAGALERFRGGERPLAEYVRDEIVGPLAADQRSFITRCSILKHLSGELCDAVLGRSDSSRLLRALASRSLVMLPLETGGQWYRCHSLVREVLQDELALRDAGEPGVLHGRASRWFGERGDIDQAIQHAVAAGETQRVGELLWHHAPEYLMRGRDARVQRWLTRLTEEQTASSPRLALCAAFSHIDATDLAAAEHWARAASSALASGDSDPSDSLYAGVALVDATVGRDGIEPMGQSAERAHALLSENSPWRALCRLLGGVADHLSGERASAREKLDDGVHAGRAVMPAVAWVCMAQLAVMDAEDADWERASDRIALAAEGLESAGLDHQPLATVVFAASSWVAGQAGRADDAKRDLSLADRLLGAFGGSMPWYDVETRILVARASTHLADARSARTRLSQASRLLRRMPDVPAFHVWLDDAWADIDRLSVSALTGPGSLTIAELRILRFLPTHLSFREIGERLHVSTNTVKSQAHAVYSKLGASSRSEAVAHASALGLIDVTVV